MVCGCCSVKEEEDDEVSNKRRNASPSRKMHDSSPSLTSATEGSFQQFYPQTPNSPLSASASSPLSRIHIAALASSPPPTLQSMMDRVDDDDDNNSDAVAIDEDMISDLAMDDSMGMEHEQDVAAVAWLRGRSLEEEEEQEEDLDDEEDNLFPPTTDNETDDPDNNTNEIIQWEQAHEAERKVNNNTALGELHPLDPLHHLQQQQRNTILEAASRKQQRQGEALMDVSSLPNPGNFSLEQKEQQLGFMDDKLKPNNNNNKNNVSMATAATMESIEVDELSEIHLERQHAYDDDDDDDGAASAASSDSLPVDSLVEFSVANFSPALLAAINSNNHHHIDFDASRYATGNHYERQDDDDDNAEEDVTRIIESSVEESTLVIRRIARQDLDNDNDAENNENGAAAAEVVSMMEFDKILGFDPSRSSDLDDQEERKPASPVDFSENEQEEISPAPQTPQRTSFSNTYMDAGDINGEATRPNCLQGAASPLFWRSRMRAQEQAQRVQQAQSELEQQLQAQERQQQDQQQARQRALEQQVNEQQEQTPSLPKVAQEQPQPPQDQQQLRPPTPVKSNVTFQLPPSPASLNLSPHPFKKKNSSNVVDDVDVPESPRNNNNNNNSSLRHRVGGRPSPPPPPPPPPSLSRVTESTRANAGTASPTIMMTELMASSSSTEQPLPKIQKRPRVPPTREEEKAARAAAALELSDSQQKQPHPYHHNHQHHQDVSLSSTSTTASNTNSEESSSPVAAVTTFAREDALSNVPSYVDEETKEQYLTACRLLKSTIIHKNSSISSKNMPLSPSPLTPSSVQQILAQQQQQQQQQQTTTASPNDQARNVPTTAAMSSTSARSSNAVFLEQADPDIFNVESVTSSAFCLSNRGTLEAIKTTLRQKRQTLSAFPNLRLQPSDSTNRSSPAVPKMTNKVHNRRTLADGLYDEEDDETTTATGPDIPAFVISPSPSMAGSTASDGVASTATSVRDYPFLILGNGDRQLPGVLTPRLMEALRGFFPSSVAGANFWLKFANSNNPKNDDSDSESSFSSLPVMLDRIYQSKYTVIGVETKEGHVFGSFCSSPWRAKSSWFGSSEAFLWRLKRSRMGNQQVHDSGSSTRSQNRRGPNYEFDNEMEIYPCSSDEQIQYCTEKTIAVGGGDWDSNMNGMNRRPKSPKMNRDPSGIGFMIDGDLMGGETNPCATFNNPRLSLGTGNNTNNRNEFDIVHLEVWTLTPCSTIDDAHAFEEGQDVLGNYAQIRRESLLSTPPPPSLLGDMDVDMDLGEV